MVALASDILVAGSRGTNDSFTLFPLSLVLLPAFLCWFYFFSDTLSPPGKEISPGLG